MQLAHKLHQMYQGFFPHIFIILLPRLNWEDDSNAILFVLWWGFHVGVITPAVVLLHVCTPPPHPTHNAFCLFGH